MDKQLHWTFFTLFRQPPLPPPWLPLPLPLLSLQLNETRKTKSNKNMRQMHLQNYLFSIIWHFVIVVVVAIVLWLFTIFITIWIFFPSPQFHSVNAAAVAAVVVVVFRVRYYYYFCCCCIVFSTFFLHHHRINIINGMHNKYACVHLIYWKRNRLKPKMSLIVNTYYNHKITIEKGVAWNENAPNAFIHSLSLSILQFRLYSYIFSQKYFLIEEWLKT